MTTNERGTLLEVRDIRREYPTPREPLVILSGASFTLERGRSMAVMGPSGSGKSTLLQIIGTLDRPNSGSVRLEGVDPFSLAPCQLAAFRNEKIGFVFQDHCLLPQCTVLENVLIPALVSKNGGAGTEKRAAELIAKVGLSERIEHRPAELSGGERQRVAVARAMINSPAVMLCDEPTGNLDRKASESIGALFRDLQSSSSTSLVVVTHSAEFAALFDQVYQLVDGKLERQKGAGVGQGAS